MRMLLLPKSMEEQFIKRVCQSNECAFTADLVVLMQEILFSRRQPPQDHRTGAHACHLVLAVCRDGGGHGDAGSYAEGVVHHLRRLCVVIGLSADISLTMFSFADDEERMMATLRGCDIFYMGAFTAFLRNGLVSQSKAPRAVFRKRSRDAFNTTRWRTLGYAGVLRLQAR